MVGLPKEKAKLGRTLSRLVEDGKMELGPRRVEWYINYWYLQGVRKFWIESWKTGSVRKGYEVSEGKYTFRLEEVLDAYSREIGQLMKINTLPFVEPRTRFTLDSMRAAAMAQIYLDNVTAGLKNDEIKRSVAENASLYGTVGLHSYATLDATLHAETLIETVPAWQLCPVPVQLMRLEDRRAICRFRKVPYRTLREQQADILNFPSKDSVKNPDARLKLEWVRVGDKADDEDISGTNSTSVGVRPPDTEGPYMTDGDSDSEPYVELIEYWEPDAIGRLLRTSVVLGEYTSRDVLYKDTKPTDRPWNPMAIIRHTPTGGFYGRPYVSPLVALNSEWEAMLARQFKNVKTASTLPITLVPANQGMAREHFMGSEDPKVIFYERDYTGEKLQVEQINPVNSGDFPGRTAATCGQLMDRKSRNSPLLRGEAPGRIENAPGLGFLYETMNISNNSVLSSIDAGYSQVYASILARGKDLLPLQDKMVLSTVDDNIAGIMVDQATATISLSKDVTLPSPDDVKIAIRERYPKPTDARIQQILLNQKIGNMDKYDVVWRNHVEELDMPIENEDIVDQIKLCKWRNVVQFGDGTLPQQLSPGLNELSDEHRLHIKFILKFMRRPTFQFASQAVRDAFEMRLEDHQAAIGQFNEGLVTPGEPGSMGAPPAQLPPSLQQEAVRLQMKAMQGAQGAQ